MAVLSERMICAEVQLENIEKRFDRFEDRLQSSILSVLNDNEELYLNQYAKMFTEDELGSFDIVKFGRQAVLEFYPLDGRTTEYNYSFILN